MFKRTVVGKSFYGNPAWEQKFVYNTFEKINAEFKTDPENTRVMLVVPYLLGASW